MQTFRDMKVYGSSYEMALEMYRLTERLPARERYELARQLRRAATSIPLNIAEGYGRKASQSDFANFVRIALGSAHEVLVLLDFSRDLGYLSESDHERFVGGYTSLIKQMKVLGKSLKKE